MLRNALHPFVSVVGITLPTIISGALIIEFLFDYLGLGLLYWNSQQTRTFPVMLGIVLLLSVLVVVALPCRRNTAVGQKAGESGVRT